MVSQSGGRVTFIASEVAVLRMLVDGPADVARRTERFTKRPAVGSPFELRTVEQRVVKRLQKAGYVRVDLAGHAHLTDKAREAMAAEP